MISMITGKENEVPKYEYLAVYAGQIKARFPFSTRKEADAFYTQQSAGLGTNSPHRIILRNNGKTIKDTWHVG